MALKREIRAMAEVLAIPLTDSKVSRMATRIAKQEQTGPIEVSQFWLVYNNADPTPAEAIRNLERNPK